MSQFDSQLFGKMIAILAILLFSHHASHAQSASETETAQADAAIELTDYPLAILPFKERGKSTNDEIGQKVTDLAFAQLAIEPELHLVDREDLGQILAEAELSLSGLTNPDTAIKIGNLTGAKLLVTGSVFYVDDDVYVVGKIISTETSRVVGASAKGSADDSLGDVVKKLGNEIVAAIKKNADQLVVKREDRDSRFAELAKKFKARKPLRVSVSIPEKHVGEATFDPAAETELITILKQCGFEVFDAKLAKKSDVDLKLTGEGLSEYATRVHNLVSVKARLEVKITDRKSGEIVASDRQTCLAVDLAEQVAGKQALQNAAADVAERLLRQLLESEQQ